MFTSHFTETYALSQLKDYISGDNQTRLVELFKEQPNQHFFDDCNTITKEANFHFNSIDFSNRYIAIKETDDYQRLAYRIIIDTKIDVELSDINFSATLFSLDVTIHARISKQSTTYIGFDFVSLLNSEQKVLLQYNMLYEKVLNKIGIDLSNELDNREQEFEDSKYASLSKYSDDELKGFFFFFFDELYECRRNIWYSVGCANLWGKYLTHYSNESHTFQGKPIYPVSVNFYDFRFFFFLENAIEQLYNYWERIAYLINEYLPIFGISKRAPSFRELFESKKGLLKVEAVNFQLDDPSSNLNWFFERKKNEHRTLCSYRHPLVHYNNDGGGTVSHRFSEGRYIAKLQKDWVNNSGNPEELKKLFEKFRNIQSFINDELKVCPVALKKAVSLIDNIRSNLPKDPDHIVNYLLANRKGK